MHKNEALVSKYQIEIKKYQKIFKKSEYGVKL